jgi:hypothetical protein
VQRGERADQHVDGAREAVAQADARLRGEDRQRADDDEDQVMALQQSRLVHGFGAEPEGRSATSSVRVEQGDAAEHGAEADAVDDEHAGDVLLPAEGGVRGREAQRHLGERNGDELERVDVEEDHEQQEGIERDGRAVGHREAAEVGVVGRPEQRQREEAQPEGEEAP